MAQLSSGHGSTCSTSTQLMSSRPQMATTLHHSTDVTAQNLEAGSSLWPAHNGLSLKTLGRCSKCSTQTQTLQKCSCNLQLSQHEREREREITETQHEVTLECLWATTLRPSPSSPPLSCNHSSTHFYFFDFQHLCGKRCQTWVVVKYYPFSQHSVLSFATISPCFLRFRVSWFYHGKGCTFGGLVAWG